MSKREKVAVVARDGVASRVTVFPADRPEDPVVICFPAMGVRAAYYEPLAEHLQQVGWNVVTADLRGKGEFEIRASRRCDYGYHEMVQYDWPAVMDCVRTRFPDARLAILGHSLGGQMSTLYMSATPGVVSALVLVACPSVYCRVWPFPWNLRLLLMTQAFRAISFFVGYFPGKKVGFAGTDARTLIRDWAHTTLTGRYELIHSTVSYETLYDRFTEPLLAVSFSDDPLAPKKAVETICAKLTHACLTHWHFTPQDLGLERLGHVEWVKNSRPLVERITPWLREAVGQAREAGAS